MTTIIRPFSAGGYFPIHNYVFDVCMPALSNAGWRVLCVAIRKTWGWVDDDGPMGRKEWDVIAYSQFLEGSGLRSRASVSKGVSECLAANYIVRRQIGRHPGTGAPVYEYALNVNYEATASSKIEPVVDAASSKIEPTASSKTVLTKGNKTQSQDENKDSCDGRSNENNIDDDIVVAWEATCRELSYQMQRVLERSTPIAIRDDVVVVRLTSPIAVAWVDNRLRPRVERAWQAHAGDALRLEFCT